MIGIIASIVFAYLMGSIPTAVWVGKWFYGVDVRNEGSGNAGATNTIRVLGLKAGIPVLLIDVIKGSIAVAAVPLIMGAFGNDVVSPLLKIGAATAAVVGHTLPLFAGFRGGKGVATLLGVGLALFPVAAWVAVAIFAIVLTLSRYVSLASIRLVLPFLFWCFLFFLHPTGLTTYCLF